jgi:putative salt-induced outer membrane protein
MHLPSTSLLHQPTDPGRNSRRLAASICLSLVAIATQAQTQTDGLWHGDISIGGSTASGNTRATTLALRTEASRATTDDKLALSALLNYGTSQSDGLRTRSAELARAGGRYDRNLGPRLFAFGGADGEVNKPGGIRSRWAVNAGAGWHLLRQTRTSWDVFSGLGYTDASFTDGHSRSGAEWLLGQESSHQLGQDTRFKQRFVVYTGGSDTGQRATFDATLATAVLGGWTLNTGLVLRYASEVAPGLKKHDSLLTFGFGYKY